MELGVVLVVGHATVQGQRDMLDVGELKILVESLFGDFILGLFKSFLLSGVEQQNIRLILVQNRFDWTFERFLILSHKFQFVKDARGFFELGQFGDYGALVLVVVSDFLVFGVVFLEVGVCGLSGEILQVLDIRYGRPPFMISDIIPRPIHLAKINLKFRFTRINLRFRELCPQRRLTGKELLVFPLDFKLGLLLFELFFTFFLFHAFAQFLFRIRIGQAAGIFRQKGLFGIFALDDRLEPLAN